MNKMYSLFCSSEEPETIEFKDLKIGDIAQIVDEGHCAMYVDQIVLRAWNGVVSLTDPTNTWNVDALADCGTRCRRLPEGTKIVLKI